MTPRRVDVLSVQAKLRLLLQLVEDLDQLADVDEERLSRERLVLRAVERLLTQVVEVSASLCSHVASASGAAAATTYRGAFTEAAAVGLIDDELAARFRSAAGMRNLLVHEYVRVDLALVAAAVPRAREDARSFVREVGAWLLRQQHT